MSKVLILLAVVALTFTTAYGATNVRQCPGQIPLPLQTTVNDCVTMPCPLAQGSTVVLRAIFRSTSYTTTTRAEVIATALGEDVNYPLPQTNGCAGFLDAQCPIDEGEIITYELQMPILSIYPRIPLSMRFSLYDERNDSIFCFIIDAQVV